MTLLIVGVVGLGASMLNPSGKDGQYAVVGPPWFSLGQTIALIEDADGSIADMGGLPNVVIAHSERSDFVSSLYRAGAWLVVDPVRLRGCLGFQPTVRSSPA